MAVEDKKRKSFWFVFTCEHYSELSSQFLDRPLTWKERIAFYVHHVGCTFCRRFTRQIRAIDSVLRAEGDSLEERLEEVSKLSAQRRQKIQSAIQEEEAKQKTSV